MTNILNPKPRFGYNPDTAMIYDYVAQRDISPTDKPYDAIDGSWNLVAVRDAIMGGLPIEGGHVSVKKPVPVAAHPATTPPTPTPGLVVAPSTTKPGPTPQPTTVDALHPQPGAPGKFYAGTTGLSGAQLTALKLSSLQAAALGLTQVQLTATGVPASTVAGWGLNEARAYALNLTAEQRAVLLP